jgi:hypothetical protein
MTATVWESEEGRYDGRGKLLGEKHVDNHAGCLECSWKGPRRKPTPAGAAIAQSDADSHNQDEHTEVSANAEFS